MKQPRPTAAAAALTLVATAGLAVSGDWPRWRGSDLTGVSKEQGLKLDWDDEPSHAPGRPRSAPATHRSPSPVAKVFTLGLEEPKKSGLFRKAKGVEVVRALDEKTGRQIWEHHYPTEFKAKFYDGGTSGTPTVDGDTVYVFGQMGDLIALDIANGKPRWQKNLADELGLPENTWGLTGSPLVYGDLLVLNAGQHGTAVDKKSGEVKWKSPATGSGYSTPIPITVGGEQLLAIFSAKALHAVNPANGDLAWSYPWETKYDVNAADPVPLGGDRLFISSGYGRGGTVLKLSPGGAEKVWENTDIRTQFNPAVYIGGFLYGIDGNTSDGSKCELKCIDPADGSVKWSERIGFGGVTAVGDTLIALNERGELITAKATPDGFEPLSRFQAISKKCWTIPTVANGKLFVRNQAGTLIAYSAK